MKNGAKATLTANTSGLKFSNPNDEDGAKIWELVKQSGVLDLNSAYSYFMMVKFFKKTCLVAKHGDQIAGFVTALVLPEKPDTIFVWQIGVAQEFRGQGIGTKLLKALLESEGCKNTKFIEATISPSNQASQSLFIGMSQKLGTRYSISDCFPEQWFPEGNHEKEQTYRIGPIKYGGNVIK